MYTDVRQKDSEKRTEVEVDSRAGSIGAAAPLHRNDALTKSMHGVSGVGED